MSGHGVLALVGGTVIDGTGGPPVQDAAVLVVDGRVEALGAAGANHTGGGATTVDTTGCVVMPGFIDSHTHVEENIPEVLAAFLAQGVTSVGNTGGGPGSIGRMHQYGNDRARARGFAAGQTLTAPGGYPSSRGDGSAAFGLRGEDAARAAVDERAAEGADFVKLALEPSNHDARHPRTLPVLGAAEAIAATRRAHEHGLVVRAHVNMLPQLEVALAAGVDSIEHLLFPLPPDTTYLDLYDSGNLGIHALPEFPRILTRMAEAGVHIVPTIGMELVNTSLGLPEGDHGALPAIEETLVSILAEVHQAGLRIALGDDWVGIPTIPPGLPVSELAYFRQAGLSDVQIVEAATRNAATLCGQGADLGTLQPGMRADITVVEDEAFTDLSSLRNPRMVIKDGKVVVDRATAPTS